MLGRWQRKARVVQPVRQLDRLAQELPDAFDRSTKLRRRNAKAREEVVESRAEISRRTLERRERELRHPEMVPHHRLTQQLGVDRDPALQVVEPPRGIEQGDADSDLSEIRRPEESEGRLLQEVELVPSCFGVADNTGDMLDAAIDEIDALTAKSNETNSRWVAESRSTISRSADAPIRT